MEHLLQTLHTYIQPIAQEEGKTDKVHYSYVATKSMEHQPHLSKLLDSSN